MSYIPMSSKGSLGQRVSFILVDDLAFSERLIMLPPLYMQYNPQNWSHSYKKLVNRFQTIGAYVEQYWGEDLDTITASATTGGFVSEEEGYTTYERRKTLPYQKFQDVLDLYRNNGNYFDSYGNIIKKGTIVLNFSSGTYLGYFENFNYTEDANSPYRFVFDFTFKVLKSYTGR